MKIGLEDILEIGGWAKVVGKTETKLVRHHERPDHPVQELRRDDGLEVYQSYQAKDKFRGAKRSRLSPRRQGAAVAAISAMDDRRGQIFL